MLPFPPGGWVTQVHGNSMRPRQLWRGWRWFGTAQPSWLPIQLQEAPSSSSTPVHVPEHQPLPSQAPDLPPLAPSQTHSC